VLVRGPINRRATRQPIDSDVVGRETATPGDQRVLRRDLTEQHRLRQRRLLIRLARLLGEQDHISRGICPLGLDGREDSRWPTTDNNNLTRSSVSTRSSVRHAITHPDTLTLDLIYKSVQ
jgi:hypothetical protein